MFPPVRHSPARGSTVPELSPGRHFLSTSGRESGILEAFTLSGVQRFCPGMVSRRRSGEACIADTKGMVQP